MVVGNESEQSEGDDLVGRVLAGRYRVVEVRSTGANTIICAAVDIQASQPVTFKIVQPELSASEEFCREFRRRAELATALSHPNIAAVLDWGDVDIDGESSVFWVVEHLGGGSLRDVFDRGRLLEPSQALVVGLEACRALDAAHQRGIAHTELTPSKLVFGSDHRLRIIDFGMAELIGRAAWAEPATVATHVARYASPEQALGFEVGPKTDVFALALCLLEAVTGKVPFAADSTVSTLAARVDKLMPVSADLGSLASVIERAGRPEPEDRFTAAEFGRALVQAAESLPRPEPIPIIAATLFDSTMAPDAGAADAVDSDAPDAPDATEPAGSDAVALAGTALTGTVLDDIVPDDTAVNDTISTDTALDDTLLIETVPDDPALADTALDDTALDDTALDDTALDDTALDDTLLDDTLLIEAVPVDGSPGSPDTDTLGTDTLGMDTAEGVLVAELPADSTIDDPIPEHHGDGLVILDEPEPEPDTNDELAALVDETDTSPAVDSEATPNRLSPAAAAAAVPAGAVSATEQMPVTAIGAAEPASQIYDDERPKRRTGVLVMLALFVLAGIAAVAFAAFYLLRVKSYEVPALAGVEQEVALNEIAGNDWVVLTEFERSDDEPDAGQVIRTFPLPGAVLEEGSEFTLFVSEGPLFRVLPDVTGMTSEQAAATLSELQLQSIVDAEEFDEEAEPGVVLSWRVLGAESTLAGAEVLPGTNVALTVSKGPAPRTVPDVQGLSLEDAQTAAAGVQLVVVAGEDAFSDEVPEGIIISQDTLAGAELPRDASFTVTISKGLDLITLPDLEGLSFPAAQTALIDAGFTIGSVLGTTEGTFESLSIVAEGVGDQYRRNTTVDLIFL